LGPYEIEAPLGQGGMGEVYKARDTRLGRHVAIKVLPASVADDADYRRRLEREGRTISRLQHPNICTLYDVGEERIEERPMRFLVMEYLEGESLAERLRRGPLPVGEALRVGREIAEAIEAAHRAGVVHRDLKPGNVMVTRTGAKVLDFGVAKTSLRGAGRDSSAGSAASPSTQLPTLTSAGTAEGTLVGTMAYMAPEQLEGSEADHRSDVWGLGCVLYEIVTGARPFHGATQASLIASIMTGQPEPPTRRRPLAPPRLDWVVKRCLERDPERRWQSARDVAIELEALEAEKTPAADGASGGETASARPRGARRRGLLVAAGAVVLALVGVAVVANRSTLTRAVSRTPSGPPLTAIAVLPFDDLSPGGDHGWLGNGMAEDLIEMLSRTETLQVVARTSSQIAKQRGADIPGIGKLLNVGSVVEGSVRSADGQLRVTAQLIRVADGYHLWSGRYDRKLDDVFAIQEQIGREIAEALRAELGVDDTYSWLRRARYQPPDVRAYQLVKKGVDLDPLAYTEETVRQQVEYYQQALEVDPDYAQAYAQLGWSHYYLWLFRFDYSVDARERARAAALRAVQLEPTNGVAQNLLGYLSAEEGDPKGALGRYERAVEVEPGHGPLRTGYGFVLLSLGSLGEAAVEMQKGVALDPLYGNAHWGMGSLEIARRSYPDAIAHLERGAQLDNLTSIAELPFAEHLNGRAERALEAWVRLSELRPATANLGPGLRRAYAERGLMGVAASYMESIAADYDLSCGFIPWYGARVFAILGDAERMFACLDASMVEHKAERLAKVHPVYDPYRGDPRFRAILERLGLAE
jgi:TolB-like protein/Tfp pilus assembly protein PilF/predicted Ser/Thr protein kinase